MQARAEGSADVREYYVGDLKADEGSTEINTAIANLRAEVVGKNVERRRQTPL